MVHQSSQAIDHGDRSAASSGIYTPGVCNIGPAEIARRRRAGHMGALGTGGLFALLVVIDAPPPARLLVGMPAMIAASGYLQARLRFCAGFGSRGVYNFGPAGTTEKVADEEARRRDRAMAMRLSLASFLIGAAVCVAAVMLPV